MSTPETSVKEKLNRLDQKIAKLAGLDHQRITFGPFSASGLPDRWTQFGTATFFNEVKADGEKPTKLQSYKLVECERHGIPGMAVIGTDGVRNYAEQVGTLFSEEAVEARIAQYRADCAKVREAVERLASA